MSEKKQILSLKDLSNDELVKSIIEQVPDEQAAAEPLIEEPAIEDRPVENVVEQKENPQNVSHEKKLSEMSQEEIEAKARLYGWHSEYDGPNKKTAKQFLEDGEKRVGLALKDKERLEKENEVLKKYNQSLLNSSAETIKKLTSDYDKRIAELEKEKASARENLDLDAYDKATNEQNQIKEEKQKVEAAQPKLDPIVELWARENADFVQKVESDEIMESYANHVAMKMHSELVKLPPVERFQKVMERVKSAFPDKFTNPNQEQAPRPQAPVRTQSVQRAGASDLTISTLPKEDKDGYDIIVKSMRFKTSEEKKDFDKMFLENYKLVRNIK